MARGTPTPEHEDQSPADAAALTALEAGEITPIALAIARRYYFQDESKVEIAKRYDLSRFQVARILQNARRDGLVRIDIGSPGRVVHELSDAVRDHFALAGAIVVEAHPTSPAATFDFVGQAMAIQLQTMINDGDILGLTWSRAMPAMAAALSQLTPCTVVQLAGAIYPPDGLPGSVEIVRQVAIAADGNAHSLYAPLVVPDTPTAAGLRRQPEIAATLARADRLDVAVLSVGAWQPSASAVFDLLAEADREELSRLGICAEVSGRVIDADGQFVDSPLNDRIIGATAEQLLAVPRLLTSASGAHRSEATKAAIKAGLVHTLVIDDRLARALLE